MLRSSALLFLAGVLALVGALNLGERQVGWDPALAAAGAPGSGNGPDDLVRAGVVEVIDGDTFVVAFAGTPSARARLVGVDAPESVHPTRGVEPYGLAAAAFLADLLRPGIELRLEFDVEVADQNGRLLVYAYLPDGRMVNEVLLEAGYAQIYTFPPNVRYVERFRAAQRAGREQGRGLWAIPAEGDGEGPGPRVVIASVDLEAEQVEIWNGTARALEMTGWRLISVQGGQEYEFPEGFVLGPGEAVVVTSGSAFQHQPPATLGWTRRSVWANRGDPAELVDPSGRVEAAFP
ncbi:nuclease [Limnochorda pilosa]|uniref:Nuclease n=1 Tax=Limnochorda pilosa TaxID=1555112 RepID=A0A0K2SMG2_LIMPI|nr:nuclease [Limnochorda pilosa]